MQRSSFIPNRTWLNKQSRAPAYTSHVLLRTPVTFGGSSRVRLGIKEEGSVSASSDQDHSTLFFFSFFPRVNRTVGVAGYCCCEVSFKVLHSKYMQQEKTFLSQQSVPLKYVIPWPR